MHGFAIHADMGRRADHSRVELTALAIDAAHAIIMQHGACQVTVRRLAAAIGYSPGTIYNLFKDIDDVLLHVAGQALNGLLARIAAQDLPADPALALHAMAKIYFHYAQEQALVWRLVMTPDRRAGYRYPLWYRLTVLRVLQRLEQALVPWFGHANSERRRRAALALFSSMHGICAVTQSGSFIQSPYSTGLALAKELIDAFITKWANDITGLDSAAGTNNPIRVGVALEKMLTSAK
jgi:AcrR family transcriptional regulator